MQGSCQTRSHAKSETLAHWKEIALRNESGKSALAVWEQNQRETTKVFAHFAASGDVDSEHVFITQQALFG